MKIKRFTSNVKKKSQTCTTAKESSVHHSKGGTWSFLQMTISTLVSVHGCKTHLKHMNPGKGRKIQLTSHLKSGSISPNCS